MYFYHHFSSVGMSRYCDLAYFTRSDLFYFLILQWKKKRHISVICKSSGPYYERTWHIKIEGFHPSVHGLHKTLWAVWQFYNSGDKRRPAIKCKVCKLHGGGKKASYNTIHLLWNFEKHEVEYKALKKEKKKKLIALAMSSYTKLLQWFKFCFCLFVFLFWKTMWLGQPYIGVMRYWRLVIPALGWQGFSGLHSGYVGSPLHKYRKTTNCTLSHVLGQFKVGH